MAYTNITLQKLSSDLVVDQEEFNVSYDEANITPAGVIPFGTVVFRAKGLAKSAPWAKVAVAADIAATNEYAVVYGDQYGFKADFIPKAIAALKYNSVVIKRQASLKEYYIKAVHATALGAAPYNIMKQLLADQQVIVLDDVTNFTGTVV